MASRVGFPGPRAILFVLLLAASSKGAEVVVWNVRARQLDDGTKRVEVLYDLAGAPAGGATVTVAFSATGDPPYSIAPVPAALSGDVGSGVASGEDRRILWDCVQTLAAETYATTYRAAVTAVAPGAEGQEITVYLGPGDTVPLVLVRIPGGTFLMGAGPFEQYSNYDLVQHEVTIAQDYYLGKTEVTQAQWQAVMGTNPSFFPGCGSCPVEQVSWDDVAGPGGFIDKLNGAQGTTRFRLPTEAEWEYAARAGTTTEFSFQVPMGGGWDTGCVEERGTGGLAFPEAEPYMWWCGNAARPQPVGQKRPNPWGLFDVHGNVWEWVQDWWHRTYEGAPADGSAWLVPAGSYRVLRGGSWYHARAHRCRSAQRFADFPDHRSKSVGFRLARSQ